MVFNLVVLWRWIVFFFMGMVKGFKVYMDVWVYSTRTHTQMYQCVQLLLTLVFISLDPCHFMSSLPLNSN